ncbi:MAG: ribulose-phosphate 3-epimerase, partial [Actinobacteria bacterium]|nr:ribulose-phosphate 3-epimerase [Actinomycetota bacterium]
IRAAGKRSGLAIKPNTPIEVAEELLDVIDMILVMTVEPGFGGQSFMESMMPKVEKARHWLKQRTTSDIWLQVDGGISLQTISIARKAGADTFVAGSSVYKSANPAMMVEELRNIATSA